MPSRDPDLTDAPRVLLVRLSHLGDVCHALPVYHAVRRRHPEAPLAWIVQTEFAELVASLPGVEPVIHFDRRGGPGAWLRARRQMRAFRPTWTIDCQGNLKSALATRLSGAPRRTGPHPEAWREPLGARAINDHAPPPYGRHAIHRMQAIVERIDFAGDPPDASWPLTDEARARGRDALSARLPDRGRRRWLVLLGREGDGRSWPAEHVAAFVREMAEARQDVLLVAGPAERALGGRLAGELAGVEGVVTWIDQAGVLELGGLLAAAAEAGVRVIANDSGPGHLAASVGCGLEWMVGSQDPALTGPWPLVTTQGSPHRLHRPPAGDRIQDVTPSDVARRCLEEVR